MGGLLVVTGSFLFKIWIMGYILPTIVWLVIVAAAIFLAYQALLLFLAYRWLILPCVIIVAGIIIYNLLKRYEV